MTYDKAYYANRDYARKQQLLNRHVLEVLKWATQSLRIDLLDGRGKRALDVGCALGFTTQIISRLGYETLGLDISSWGIKKAKTQIGGQFLVCDAQSSLPFSDNVFDLVTCFDVLEHLPNPKNALQEMFNVCKGILVCTTPNKKMDGPVRKFIGDYDETHISTKTQKEWQDIVCKNLPVKEFHVDAFYDLTIRFRGQLFFKSFNLPKYGLTIRMTIRK